MKVYEAQEGYDLAASFYDDWHWSRFWALAERPIVERMAGDLSIQSVIDIGCGTGLYTLAMATGRNEVCAVDASIAMLDVLKAKVAQLSKPLRNTFDIRHCGVGRLYWTWEKFGVAVASKVFSHIEDIDEAVAKIHACLLRRGSLIITDLHEAHEYEHTGVKRDAKTKVTIRSFRRPAMFYIKLFLDAGMMLADYHEITLESTGFNATAFPQFGGCDQRRPISFVAKLVK